MVKRERKRIRECVVFTMSFVIYHQAVTQGLNRVDKSREREAWREL